MLGWMVTDGPPLIMAGLFMIGANFILVNRNLGPQTQV